MTDARRVKELEAQVRRLEAALASEQTTSRRLEAALDVAQKAVTTIAEQRDRESVRAAEYNSLLRGLVTSLDLALAGTAQRADGIGGPNQSPARLG